MKPEPKVDTDIESEPDLFLDAQENTLDPPLRNSEYGSDSEPESDTIQPHNISLPVSDSSSVTFVKTVLESCIMQALRPNNRSSLSRC